MSLKKYGVLKGRVIASRLGAGSSPHFQIHVVDEQDDWRIAVNVKSKLSPSELLYLVDSNFQHPVLEMLRGLPAGFSALPSKPGGAALDFIRANLFDKTNMTALPFSVPGPDNDLNEKIQAFVSRAEEDEQATVYAFGEPWGPETIKDKIFGFKPGRGIHDIHMNQGNVGTFREDDGVWQDGALILHFPAIMAADGSMAFPEQWVGVFLAFQSQSWHTDDATGHSIDATGQPMSPDRVDPVPSPGDGRIRILAALANPTAEDAGRETVTLFNPGAAEVSLKGWAIADRMKRKTPLAGPVLAAGEAARISLGTDGAQLSNEGGIITLLDPAGLKVDGVSFTKNDASKQGTSIVF